MSGIRLGCVGDIHARFDRLEAVAASLKRAGVDGIVAVGDFAAGPFNEAPESVVDVLGESLRILTDACPNVIYVPGNHDHPHVAERNVDGRHVEWLGLRVFGKGGGGPTRFGFPYEWDDDQPTAEPAKDCDVILSHTPPYDTSLDVMANGKHVGSRIIRRWATALHGLLVCGHIHEAVQTQKMQKCLCYNAGSLGDPYGRSQYGIAERPARSRVWRVRHYTL